MAPEYRIYVPPEAKDKFEGFVSTIEGSQTWRINSPSDLVLSETLELVTLAQKVRNVIDALPEVTRLKDLVRPNAAKADWKIPGKNTPPQWADFVKNLPPREKSLVVQKIGNLFKYLTSPGKQDDIALEDLRELNWEKEEELRRKTDGKIPAAIRFGRRIFGETNGLVPGEVSPIVTSDIVSSQKENRRLVELIGVFRSMFAENPRNTKFQDLYRSDNWTILTDTLTVPERVQITTTFSPLLRSEYGGRTLEDLSQIDWSQFPEEGIFIRNFGPKRTNFLRKTMEGLTFPDSQPKSLESEN